MKRKILTLQQIYKEGKETLEENNVPDASLDAWLLLSRVTGVSRARYYGNPDQQVTSKDAQRYFEWIELRCRRIPLQHITGEQEFMGLSFCVNEHVLIPRQDTEVLVEEGLKVLRPGMKILDMCIGSGCILLSLLKINEEKIHAKGVSGFGVDVSKEALSVAKQNAEALDVNAEFLESDLFEKIEGKYDLIVSNPPYIPTADIETLQEEVKDHDPRIALDGHEDGLYFYRKIVRESVHYIKEGGYLMMEIGCEQAGTVSGLMKKAGYGNIQVKKDLSGLDRVVSGIRNCEGIEQLHI